MFQIISNPGGWQKVFQYKGKKVSISIVRIISQFYIYTKQPGSFALKLLRRNQIQPPINNIATYLLLFRPSTPYRPRRTVPSSSRCLSTSSPVSCHRCRPRPPLLILPPLGPLWRRPQPKSFLNFCLSFSFCIYLFFVLFRLIKYENKIRTTKHFEITT